MCQSATHQFLRALPKCEHHIHIEGALSPSLLFQLAAKNNITLPKDDEAFASPEALLARYERFTCLDDFLHYYYIGMSALVTAADFEALAWNYFQRASADGVHHAEVFFDPQAHTARGIQYASLLDGFNAARSRAKAELGITTELICCFLRHLPVPDSLSLFEHEQFQASWMGKQIIGIGLDSSEKDFPPELFVDLYKNAREAGLRVTAHAGEEGPAEYVAAALGKLGVQRVDHGIRSVEDDKVLEALVRSKTMLTVCPLSNVVLRCVKEVAEVPIRKFLEKGVRFSINSDDPAYFGGYILDNYCKVHEAFNLSVAEWGTICTNAIEGSWCGEERKKELLEALGKVLEEWNGKEI